MMAIFDNHDDAEIDAEVQTICEQLHVNKIDSQAVELLVHYLVVNKLPVLFSDTAVDRFLELMDFHDGSYYPTTQWQRAIISLLPTEQRYSSVQPCELSERKHYSENLLNVSLEWMRVQIILFLNAQCINCGDRLEIL